MQRKSGSTKESIIWTTILPACFQIVKFGFSIILARILNPFDFGVVGIAGVIIFYSNSFTNLGLGNAIIQKKNITQDHLNTFFTLNLSFSILLVIALCFLSGRISVFYKLPELRGVFISLSTIFLISSIYIIPIIELKRDLRFKDIVKVEIIRDIFNIGIALILALRGFQFWSIIYAQIISSIIATMLIRRKSDWIPKYTFNRIAFKELKGFAFWNFCVVQINLLAEQIDKLFIGKFLGPSQLGLYDKSFNIGNMPLMFISRKISSVVFSTFSQNQDDRPTLFYYFSRSMIVNAIVSFPCYVGLFSISDLFVYTLLGEKWLPMIAAFKILLLAFMVASITSIVDNFNMSCGYFKKLATLKFYTTILMVAVLFFSAKISIVAASFTILGYYTVLLFFSLMIANHIISLGHKDLWTILYPAASASLVMYVVITLMKTTIFHAMSVSNLFFIVVIGAASYVLYLIVMDFKECRFIKDEVKSVMQKIYRS